MRAVAGADGKLLRTEVCRDPEQVSQRLKLVKQR
jgi:hypothetical protein